MSFQSVTGPMECLCGKPNCKGVMNASQARKVEPAPRKRKRGPSPSSPNSSFNMGIIQPSSCAPSNPSHSPSIPRPEMPSLVHLPTKILDRFHRAAWAAAGHLQQPVTHRELDRRAQLVQLVTAPTSPDSCPNVLPGPDPEHMARRARARGKTR